MIEQDELSAWLRLSLTPGIGNEAARRLLMQFGLPQDVFRQSAASLEKVVSAAQARALQHAPQEHDSTLNTTLAWLHEAQPAGEARAIVTVGDGAYPPILLDLPDPPLLLYLHGRSDCIQCPAPGWGVRCALAMVGSRNPTPQGARRAHDFAQALHATGITIVSGLALGIDGQAHAGALDSVEAMAASPAFPATIAVVGTGLDRVYPARHRELAHRIACNGILVSEYHLGTPPLAANFPRRNRIISGLAQGTLVVEAATASGSLITARLSAEQGREVFAIPGSVDSPQSRGCHALIRQGAKLVETVQDILEELRIPASVAGSSAAQDEKTPAVGQPHSAGEAASQEDAGPHAALLQLMGFEPVDLDDLLARSGMDVASLQAALLELELAGCVARLPGGRFQRMARA